MLQRWATAVAIALAAAAVTWFAAGGLRLGAPASAPVLEASLLASGQVLLAGPGRVALPADARFRVHAHAAQGGVLELLAVNPAGQAGTGPLWSSAILPGQTVESPDLRFGPPGGAETLTVRLRSEQGIAAESTFTVWHP